MGSAINSIISNADYMVLLFFRTGALVFSSPIFGRVNIPSRVKIGFAAALAYLFFTVFPQTVDIEYSTLIGFLLVCAGEMLIGIALAFVTNVFFTLAFVAGQIIDMQIGFGIVSVYDAQNNTQVPVFGNVLNILLLIVFFSTDGHLRLVEIIYLTIEKLPVGAVVFSPEIGLVALEIFTLAFMLGIMVAMPVIASGFTLEIVLGMFMRTVPQIQMFVVGVPLKLIVGLVVVLFIFPVFSNFSGRIFSEMFSGIQKMFSTFLGTG